MSKLNMFWVILLIYVMSFFLIVAVEVDSTVINEVEAVNYNGYFEVRFENSLISSGFLHASWNGYDYYTYNGGLEGESFIVTGTNILIYQEVEEDLPYWLFVNWLYFSFNTLTDEYDVSFLIDGHQYNYAELSYMPTLEIYGISNYRVSS